MKKSLYFLLTFFLLACQGRTVNPPPEILISEEKMENILYDLTLLNALENASLIEEGEAVFNDRFLLRKHQLADSVWQANKNFYAQDPQLMSRIYKRINARIEKAKDSIKLLNQSKNIRNEKDPSDF